MKWSWKIGEFRGIGVYVHATFLILIEFETVDGSEMLETAFRRLQSCQCHTVPVLQRGELVGLVTMDNVGEFVAIQAAEKDFAAAGSGHPK